MLGLASDIGLNGALGTLHDADALILSAIRERVSKAENLEGAAEVR